MERSSRPSTRAVFRLGANTYPRRQALTRFRQEFAELASLAEGLGDNPFPASIEVRVSQGAERDGRVDAFVKKVVQLPGVVDVRYDRDWLARVGTALDTVRAAGLMLALLMGLAAAVTVATVVRLGLLARHDEIEIMELVGAPLSYIRGPFVAEGFLQGGIGAVLAILFLWLSHAVANAWWGTELRALFDGDASGSCPFACTSLILGGMFVGSTGGWPLPGGPAPTRVDITSLTWLDFSKHWGRCQR